MSGKWEFWIDRGGTFTDIVARRPDGAIVTHKLLSENPSHYADAPLHGVRVLMGLPAEAEIPAERIAALRMGTTVATNALLERKGAPTLLVTTRGFADALRIGYQNRPDIFALRIVLPEMLYREVVEVDERIRADGTIERAPDLDRTRAALEAAFGAGLRAVAIVLLHGYRHPAHERALADLARAIGFSQVSASHEVSPLIKFVGRGDTTVADAYLSPVLRRYVEGIAAALDTRASGCRLMFMQSNGGLTDAALFRGRDALLSGPAGGVIGAARTSELAGFRRIIGFDMGGTSTDVSRFDGSYERVFETELAGVRIRAPMMAIHTVAAGGGSILHYDGARMRVGPDSAGADPGPACYRKGGPLTVTDANLMTGRILPACFPAVFGPEADQKLDAAVVEAGFARLAAEIGDGRSPEAVADGFLAVAVENMAQAIKRISIQRGYDVSDYVLACFGGAAGQHACRVADALGMSRAVLHPLAGVLSAYGMGLADITAFREQAVEAPLDAAMASLARDFERLAGAAVAEIAAQGVPPERVQVHRRVHLRYAGTDTALVVPYGARAEIAAAFADAHRQRFGFVSAREMIVEAISVEAVGAAAMPVERVRSDCRPPGEAPPPRLTTRLYAEGAWREARVFDRADLLPGDRIMGPAVIVEPHSTIVVEPGWAIHLSARDHLLLERAMPRPARLAVGTAADPVMLEIFNNLFMSVAEQMGVTLEKTAHSVNIKERLDFSCALFDGAGRLVANAPHVPVHLGSMGESVRRVIAANRHMAPGDVFALNAPYAGGTHLPDVTVIAPVFDEAGGERLFYVAARGHHADIGGRSPGSMPPDSRRVDEEGVLIDNFPLVAGGQFREAELRALLASGPYPARNIEQNLADLRAQIAACTKGAAELRALVAHFGLETVRAYMGHVQDNAAESVRRVIDRLQDGAFAVPLDNGAVIRVAVRVDRTARRAAVDFTGTSAQTSDNFNAPAAVARAAVLYVFRCLVEADIPLNEGCLAPLDIVLPEGSLLHPRHPAAVVAGNVETSQTIVDALLAALGALAASQGTMNNFTFGNARHQYYETICGGAGAGPDFDGADAVHTHMTNSRLTDPEVLEWRFPVVLESFSIRRGSGGVGRHRGGDGVVRRLRFLEEMEAAILATRRRTRPFGLAGGGPGLPGRSIVLRADGTGAELSGSARILMRPGDVLVIETPGGGGYGLPP